MRGGEERGGYRVRDDERRPPSWYDEVERRRSGGRVRDEDEGYRMRGRDEDEDRGYRMRGSERGGERVGERGGEDDERDRLGRRKGGWFGDPEGHSRAVRLGRSERDDDDRGYRMRGREEDEDRGYIARGEEDDDEDRDRLGRRKGGWFGDPEGHAEAARRRWDRTEGRE
jgi:hypothetical protein